MDNLDEKLRQKLLEPAGRRFACIGAGIAVLLFFVLGLAGRLAIPADEAGRLLPSVLLLTLPMVIMATDYGRWWTALCFTLFALPLAAAARGDKPLREALLTLYDFFRRHLLLAVALVVYLLQLAPNPDFPYFGMQQAMRLRELMGL